MNRNEPSLSKLLDNIKQLNMHATGIQKEKRNINIIMKKKCLKIIGENFPNLMKI